MTCALAISIHVPAFADGSRGEDPRHKRSLAACTSFDQTDEGDDKVAFTIHNACSIPIDCAVSWRLVCAPQSKTRRAAHTDAASFALAEGASQRTEASAATCGDSGWLIDSVRWTCRVNKD